MKKVSLILLAAGASSRMGVQNKLLLEYKGEALLSRMIKMYQSVNLFEMIIVTGHEDEKIKALIPKSDIKVVHNPDYMSGMTTSIQTGVLATNKESNGFLISVSDQPFLDAKVIQAILASFNKQENESIIVPTVQGLYFNPVLFSSGFRKEIMDCDDMFGCKPVVINNFDKVIELEFESDKSFKDIDTPKDFKNLS